MALFIPASCAPWEEQLGGHTLPGPAPRPAGTQAALTQPSLGQPDPGISKVLLGQCVSWALLVPVSYSAAHLGSGWAWAPLFPGCWSQDSFLLGTV